MKVKRKPLLRSPDSNTTAKRVLLELLLADGDEELQQSMLQRVDGPSVVAELRRQLKAAQERVAQLQVLERLLA